ncbi:MAG: hypothetical protein K4304_06010 [Propionicimonas sp.]
MHSRIVVLGLIAGLGVLTSIVMVVVGLPEQTASQQLMLELGSLPLSVALAAGNLILLERAVRRPGLRGRRALIGGALVSAVGLAVVAVALMIGQGGVVQFGQLLIFLGLGLVLLVAIRLQPSAARQPVTFSESGPLTPDAPGLDDAAPEEPNPTL